LVRTRMFGVNLTVTIMFPFTNIVDAGIQLTFRDEVLQLK